MMPSKQLRDAPFARLLAAMAVAFVFGLAMATAECPALTRAFGEVKRVISLAIAKAVVAVCAPCSIPSRETAR